MVDWEDALWQKLRSPMTFVALRDSVAVGTTIVIPRGTLIEARHDDAQGTLGLGYLILLEDSGQAYSGLHFRAADFCEEPGAPTRDNPAPLMDPDDCAGPPLRRRP